MSTDIFSPFRIGGHTLKNRPGVADIPLSGKSMLLNPDFVEHVRQGRELWVYSSEEANVANTTEPLP
jgi:2,4-dienoyl-CoA reductase-like NADH-dependent reductase (Old Yellow Enzyme family)